MGIKVKLGTFHLWKSTHYSLYPRVMAVADRNKMYTVKEIREELFLSAQRGTNGKKRRRRILWQNIWDVERENEDTLRVRGLPLFEENKPGLYGVTDIGKSLGDLYKQGSGRWKEYLSEIILKFDPRLRLIIYLMSKHGCDLVKKPSYSLRSKDVGFLNILERTEAQNLDSLLKKYGDEAVGQFILSRAGLQDEGVSTIEGVKHSSTSMDKSTLTSALRCEFQLLADIGIADDLRDRISLNYSKAKEVLGRDIYYDLFNTAVAQDFISALYSAYANKIRPNGIISFNDLKRETLRLFPETSFDHAFEQAIKDGQVRIISSAQGLRSDGEGYKGEKQQQLLELSFVT